MRRRGSLPVINAQGRPGAQKESKRSTINTIDSQIGWTTINALVKDQAEQAEKLQQELESKDEAIEQDIMVSRSGVGILFKTTKFTDEIIEHFEKFSSYNERYVATALNYSRRLTDDNEYCKMLDYFISKGPEGIKIAKEIITNSINKNKGRDRLNRNLMMAAKIGDTELYDSAIRAGASFIRTPYTLVTDDTGKNVLHYACQSSNPALVHRIAEDMRESFRDGKLWNPPKGSFTNGQFDPFRIPDDESLGTTNYNTIRPIHYISPALAAGLDVEYKLPPNAAKFTFKSAAAFFKLNNKVTEQGLAFIPAKLGLHEKSVKVGLYIGKGGAGIPVANIAAKAASAIIDNVESGLMITSVAAVAAVALGLRNVYKQNEALAHTGAHEFVLLPPMRNQEEKKDEKEQKAAIGLEEVKIQEEAKEQKPPYGYNGKTNKNHNLILALQVGDNEKAVEVVLNNYFKSTSEEVISALRQTLHFPNEFNAEFFIQLAEKCVGKDEFNGLMDILYRRNMHDIALQVIQDMQRPELTVRGLTYFINRDKIIAQWRTKFANQANPLPPPEYPEVAQRNKYLKDAFEKYDFYKIQHIISQGDFSHASKKVIKAFKAMSVYPLTPLPPVKDGKPSDQKTFMHVVYEGLAKKASPKKLHEILEDCIENQPQLSQAIIRDLINTLSKPVAEDKEAKQSGKIARAQKKQIKRESKTATKERLKVLLLLSARIGDITSLNNAINALKKYHNVHNILDIVDSKGSNILHYAAEAQDSRMVKHVLEQTSVITDFVAAEKEERQHRVFFKRKTISTAKHILEIPNLNGDTPAKMLKEKSALLSLDEYFNTVGFRLDSNESYNRKDQQRVERLDLAANVTAAAAVFGFCCGAGIPLAIGLGADIGLGLANFTTVHVLKDLTIGGGLGEGLFACFAAHNTEEHIMPKTRDLFQSLGKVWNKVRNNSYMRVNRDYDDRIITKYDEFMTSIANRLVGIEGKPDELKEIFKQETENLVNSEPGKVGKLIAQQACRRALYMVVGAIRRHEVSRDGLSYLKDIQAEADRINKKYDIDSLKAGLAKINEKFKEKIMTTHDMGELHQICDFSIRRLERLKELCVSHAEIKLARENFGPGADEKAIFIAAAEARTAADCKRQIALIPDNEPNRGAVIAALKTKRSEKNKYIHDLADSYESRLAYRREKIYDRMARVTPQLAQDHFLDHLRKLDGGAQGWKDKGKRSSKWWKEGPFTRAAIDALESSRLSGNVLSPEDLRIKLNTVCEAAYEELRRPSYAKAIEMRQAIDTFVDYRDYTSKLANRVAPRATPDLNVDAIINKLSKSTVDQTFKARFELAASLLKSKNPHEESLKQAINVLAANVIDTSKPGNKLEKFIILLQRLLNEKDSNGKIHIRHNLLSPEAQQILGNFIVFNSGLSKEEVSVLKTATQVQMNGLLIKLSSQICEIANFALRNPKDMNRISETARTLPSVSVTASVESKPQSQRTPETKASARVNTSAERKSKKQSTPETKTKDRTRLADTSAQDLSRPAVHDDKKPSHPSSKKRIISRAPTRTVQRPSSALTSHLSDHQAADLPPRTPSSKRAPDEKSTTRLDSMSRDQKSKDKTQEDATLSGLTENPPNHGRALAPINLLKNPDIYLAATWASVFSAANSYRLDRPSDANEAKSANAAANTKPGQPIRFVSETDRRQVITVDAKAVKTRTPSTDKMAATAKALVEIYLRCIENQEVKFHSVKSNNPEMTKQMVLELSKKLQLLNPNDPEIQKHKINGKSIEDINKIDSKASSATPVHASSLHRPT